MSSLGYLNFGETPFNLYKLFYITYFMSFVPLVLFAVVAFFMPEWKKGELTRNKTERFRLDWLVWNSKCRILHYVSVIKAVVVVVFVVSDLTRHANCSRQPGLLAGFCYGNMPTPSSAHFCFSRRKVLFFLFKSFESARDPCLLCARRLRTFLPSCFSSLAKASFSLSFSHCASAITSCTSSLA